MSSRERATVRMSESDFAGLPPAATLAAATMPVGSAIEDSSYVLLAHDDVFFFVVRELLANAKI